MRIRWGTALRALALIVAAPLVIFRVLKPPLLEPGPPPPPAADVGLPGAAELAARPLPEVAEALAGVSPARALGPRPGPRRRRRPTPHGPGPAAAAPVTSAAPTPPPEPAPPVPPPVPAVPAAPAPEVPPGDGSIEFMPH